MKILHTGDIHCKDDDLPEIEKCLGKIIETARYENPDLIVIAGDTFDSKDIRLDSQSAKLIFQVVPEFADIAPVAIVTGTPSHDGNAVEVLRHVKAKNQVWVSTIPEQIWLPKSGPLVFNPLNDVEDPKIIISMLPTPTKQYFQSTSDIETTNKEIAAAMSGILGGFGAKASEHSCPHILVGHFSVGGALLSPSQQMIGYDIEISRDHLELANAQVICLGHIHYPQQIGKNGFYCGSIYRKDYGELEDKGFWLHKLSVHDVQTHTFINTPTRKLFRIQCDFVSDSDGFRVPLTPSRVSQFIIPDIFSSTSIMDFFERNHPNMIEQIKDAFVRVELKAYQDDVDKIDQEGLKVQILEAGAKHLNIHIKRVPRSNVRSEKILKLDRLRDKVEEMARLRGEIVEPTVLTKCDMLEDMDPEQVVSMAVQGYGDGSQENRFPEN